MDLLQTIDREIQVLTSTAKAFQQTKASNEYTIGYHQGTINAYRDMIARLKTMRRKAEVDLWQAKHVAR